MKKSSFNACFSSSEKTTSYRRTSSGGISHGKCSSESLSCVGSQEELYCSLAGGANSSIPSPAPRPRRNAMVKPNRHLIVLHSALCPSAEELTVLGGCTDSELIALLLFSLRSLSAGQTSVSRLWWTAERSAQSSLLSLKMKSLWSQPLMTPTGG